MSDPSFSDEDIIWQFCETILTDLRIYQFAWWVEEPLYSHELSTTRGLLAWQLKKRWPKTDTSVTKH